VGEENAGKLSQEKTMDGQSGFSSEWLKYEHNPVLGGELGTCFDVAALRETDRYLLYFSWRPQASVALVESTDGIRWSKPTIVLEPNQLSGWESNINRPGIVKRGTDYHLWYTGQVSDRSRIGHAISSDGRSWKRTGQGPVLSPEAPWEKGSVMCPHVNWDQAASQFRMWYSGGDQHEPDSIGYATSPDVLQWNKYPQNPIFTGDPQNEWERHKVTACQVISWQGWHYMFYIGFRDEEHAQIGLARSRDGLTAWQRHRGNPIISPSEGEWDHDACYKPFAIFDGQKWFLWYNGRRSKVEQIGLAVRYGEDLGFRE